MQVICEICVLNFPAKETPLEKARIDLPISRRRETAAQRIRLIQRTHRGHHVDDGFGAEPCDSGAAIVLKLICNGSKKRPQTLAFAPAMGGPQWIRRRQADPAKLPPRLFGVLHFD